MERVKPVSLSSVLVRCLISILVLSTTLVAQRFVSHNKPTERVVTKYLEFVADGALLTSDGWKKASALFVESTPYWKDSEIHLISGGGSLGEIWAKDGRAMVQTKWTDDFGTIDSALHYEAPPEPKVAMTIFSFNLDLTDKHWEIEGDGQLKSESTGPQEWKIADPMRREATVEKTIAYLRMRGAETNDPKIRKNADKTIAVLLRLSPGCGNASAC